MIDIERPSLNLTTNEHDKQIWQLSTFKHLQRYELQVRHDAQETSFRFVDVINDEMTELVTAVELREIIDLIIEHEHLSFDDAKAMALDPPNHIGRRVIYGAEVDIREQLKQFWGALNVIMRPAVTL